MQNGKILVWIRAARIVLSDLCSETWFNRADSKLKNLPSSERNWTEHDFRTSGQQGIQQPPEPLSILKSVNYLSSVTLLLVGPRGCAQTQSGLAPEPGSVHEESVSLDCFTSWRSEVTAPAVVGISKCSRC